MFSTPPRAPVTQFEHQERAARSILLLSCLACILLADSLFAAFGLPQTPGRMAEPSAGLIAALPLWSFWRRRSSGGHAAADRGRPER